MAKSFFIFIFLCCILGDAHAEPEFTGQYHQLLQRHVHAAKVDYKSWKNDPAHNEAIILLKNASPEAISGRGQKLVFWINAYNLLTIDLIIKNNETESIKNLGSFFSSPWEKHSWKIGGKSYTLDYIEHKILRKMGEPRIHMAIVCASISCPDLRSEAYTVEKLEEQLADQSKSFTRGKGVALKKDGIEVSKIFKWFEGDFGGENGVLAFIKKYNPKVTGEMKVDDYLPYDWNLNGISGEKI